MEENAQLILNTVKSCVIVCSFRCLWPGLNQKFKTLPITPLKLAIYTYRVVKIIHGSTCIFPKRKLKVKTIYSWHATLLERQHVLRCDKTFKIMRGPFITFHAGKPTWNICTFENEFVTPKDHSKLIIYITIYTLSFNFHGHVMHPLTIYIHRIKQTNY